MKNNLKKYALLLSLVLASFTARAADPTELQLSVLAKLGLEGTTGGTSDTFSVTFGAFNGSFGTLLGRIGSATDTTSSFLSYFNANSRSIYTWSGLVGNAITDSETYYRNFSADSSVESYAGAPLNSIFNAAYDNSILALITNTSNDQLALIDLGVDWANPTIATAGGVLLDVASLSTAAGSTALIGTLGAGFINTATAIPEPSSASLMLLGAAGVLALRRLRKSNV